MDIQTIDNQYRQLQTQSQQTVQELRALAMKLQGSAQAGNQDAREWLLDLKSIALAIQSEQNQVANLLQALHNFMNNQQQSPWGNQQPMQPMQQPMPYPPQNYGGYPQQQGGGILGEIMNSGFGRAVAMGAGFAVGEDLIDSIF
ncbi:MAG TPA: hypothetical protein VL356_11960 [Acidocella sp.]|jgi:hypothetical protein|nr:hypothetical protein [Acidocella sp.]